MKIIPLTKGQVAIIDDGDFERVGKNKWTSKKASHDKTWYAHRAYYENGKRKGNISLHRFIMNAPDGVKVDHRDGDGLNNQRGNLRFCTHSQNLMNMRMHNKHGYKGVAYIKRRRVKQWMAKICVLGNLKTIGYFETLIEAAIAYNGMAAKHFGEFAKLNPVKVQVAYSSIPEA